MSKSKIILLSGFLLIGHKTLIVKRAPDDDFLPEFWELAGGGVELGENPFKAVEREYLEETNLNVRAVKPYHVFSDVVPQRGKQYIEIDFLLELKDEIENLKLSHEHTHFEWITRDQVEDFQISDFIKEVIYRGFREYNIF